MSEKEKSSKKDVDALLTEVASAAGVPKRAPKAAPPADAPAPKPAGPAAGTKSLRIRQIRSGICAPSDQKQALRGLGLRRIRHEVVRPDTPAIRGQILKVRHLVEVAGE
jgi:large subunit ribosomal protein L30